MKTTTQLMKAAVLVAVIAQGCIGTETGNPPLAPEVDPALVSLSESSRPGPVGDVPTYVLSGEPGALNTSEADILLLNLDGSGERVAFTIAEDLSFRAEIDANFDHVVRLQAQNESGRSQPYDYVSAATPADLNCMVPDVGSFLDFGDVALNETPELIIRVDNGCGEDVRRLPFERRLDEAAFEISIMGDEVIGANESFDIRVRARITEARAHDEVLLLNFVSADRVAISLGADGRD